MFSVYAENPSGRTTIYNDTWLRVGEYGATTVMFNPSLTLEDNQAGSFSFSIPKENQGYDKIKRYSTEIVVNRIKRNTTGAPYTETEIFRGRVINQTGDFMNNKAFTCEGELGYLKDTIQPQKKYSRKDVNPDEYINKLLNIHNSKVDKKKRFYLGNCEFSKWREDVEQSDSDSRDNQYRETNYEDTLTCISNALAELENPHIRIRRGTKSGVSGTVRLIDILKDSRDGGSWGSELLVNQDVLLGRNLLDFSKTYDMSDICSVIIPIGAQIENAEEKAHIGAPIQFNTLVGVLDEEGYYDETETNPNFVVSEAISVTPNNKYYYSGRNSNGKGMWSFFNSNDEVIEHREAASGDESTDLIEELITAPAGAHHLHIAGTTGTITLRLNNYIDSPEQIEEYVTVSSIVDNKRKKKKGTIYVKDDVLLKKYGWVEKVIEFPGVKTPELLYNKAVKYLKNDVYENLIFEVKAVDMSDLDSTITPYSIGKAVNVTIKNLDDDHVDEYSTKKFPISKLQINLYSPQDSTVTLGYQTKLTISNVTSNSSARIYDKIKETRMNISTNLKEAIDNASYLITHGMNGYVSLVRGEEDGEDIIREIVISQTPDYTAPNIGVWRWNYGGLGFSPNGYDENSFRPNVAITMDGRINADYMTTGEMVAERIRGGTFRLGVVRRATQPGENDLESQMQVYAMIDGELRKIGEWSKGGLSVYYRETTNPDTGEDYPDPWDTQIGITNGQIRGYYTGSQQGTWHRAGTLNLVRRELDGNVVTGDVSLKSEDNNLILDAANDIILRAGGKILFNYRGANVQGVTGSFQDKNGNWIRVRNGIIYEINT